MEVLNEIVHIKEILKRNPILIKGLIKAIHPHQYKEQRIPGKWTIHEHICHLAESQEMLTIRMKKFIAEEVPEFKPYFPDKEETVIPLIDQDLEESFQRFSKSRNEFLSLSENLPNEFWAKNAKHPEYYLYTPLIMFRHCMMHDQLHMYRMEELWLTKNDYLPK